MQQKCMLLHKVETTEDGDNNMRVFFRHQEERKEGYADITNVTLFTGAVVPTAALQRFPIPIG